MKYLFCFLICFSSYASFLAGSSFEKEHRRFFSSKERCEKVSGESCFRWNNSYLKGAVSIVTESFMVDDRSKPPNYSRVEEVESCGENCEALFETKKCAKEGYQVYIEKEKSRAVCKKFLGYEKMEVTRNVIKEDPVKKAELQSKFDASRFQKKQVELVFQDIEHGKKVFALVQLMNKKKGLTKAQRKTVRQATKAIRDDLFEGYLDEAKEKILALPTSELITEDDKNAAVKLINDYLAARPK